MRADQLQHDKRIFLLLIGGSGDGKTCAAASFAEAGSLYAFDMDNRINGILGHPLHERWLPNIEYDQYNLGGGFKKVDDKLEIFEVEANSRKFHYKTILFDGFTSCEEMFVFDALELTGKLPDQTKSGKERHRKLGKVTFPGWDEYNYEKLAFSQTMINLIALPCNVICTAHYVDKYSQEEGETNKVIGKKMSLRDRISQQLMKNFNEVVVFEREFVNNQVRHLLRFRSDLARTTFQQLPNSIVWSGQSFYSILMEHLKKEKNEPITITSNPR